ncbi:RsfS/YbeB/iojap family protein [archaeon]|nr:MAG: RsfS/YbeB/iojap family protein [archaeon]
MKETHGTVPQSLEGETGGGGWVCMDYGGIIVHIMTPTMRTFYKLEKKWKDAEVSWCGV